MGISATSASTSDPPSSHRPVASRLGFADLWRAVAMLSMVLYHALYDLYMLGRLGGSFFSRPAIMIWGACIGGSFFVVSGMVMPYSHSPLRRGLITFGAGLILSQAARLVGIEIHFGVLSCLGACTLLYALCHRALPQTLSRKLQIPLLVGLFVLFLSLKLLLDPLRVSVPWLYPLGFRTEQFLSLDYYPILPWIFLYAAGVVFTLGKGPLWQALARIHCPAPLAWISRHSLIIYLLHQVILYPSLLLVFSLASP